jgi:hypothetical protein
MSYFISAKENTSIHKNEKLHFMLCISSSLMIVDDLRVHKESVRTKRILWMYGIIENIFCYHSHVKTGIDHPQN